MKALIYHSKNKQGRTIARAWLSTDNPASSYGLPVLEVQIGKTHIDHSWVDILPSGISAAEFVRRAPYEASNHAKLSKTARELLRRAVDNVTGMGL